MKIIGDLFNKIFFDYDTMSFLVDGNDQALCEIFDDLDIRDDADLSVLLSCMIDIIDTYPYDSIKASDDKTYEFREDGISSRKEHMDKMMKRLIKYV